MLFVMHFGWYFGLYFGFFTLETISDGISGAFSDFQTGDQKKISGRVQGTPWNCFVLNLYVITYLSVAIFGLVFFFWV